MSDPTPRAWTFYLDDMIAFAERVLTYTTDLDQAAFVASTLHRDATIRNLELIGSARPPLTYPMPSAPPIPTFPGD